jgi:hypothetical protein
MSPKDRLTFFFENAGLSPVGEAPSVSSLTQEADRALLACGLTTADLGRLEPVLRPEPAEEAPPVPPPTVALLGLGAGALSLTGSGAILDHALEHGIEIVDFIWEKRDLFRAGWAAVSPEVQAAVFAKLIGVPGEALDIAAKLAEFFSNLDLASELATLPADSVVEVAGLVGYAAEMDWMTIVEAAGNLSEIGEAVATLGGSLALGWATGKIVNRLQQPEIEALSARCEAAQQRYQKLFAIRYVLRVGLPAVTVATQLKQVDEKHLGF